MNDVSLGKKQLCEIRAVLSGNPCNQCLSHRFTCSDSWLSAPRFHSLTMKWLLPMQRIADFCPWGSLSDNLIPILELSHEFRLSLYATQPFCAVQNPVW